VRKDHFRHQTVHFRRVGTQAFFVAPHPLHDLSGRRLHDLQSAVVRANRRRQQHGANRQEQAGQKLSLHLMFSIDSAPLIGGAEGAALPQGRKKPLAL
jgi:hypothetical protein